MTILRRNPDAPHCPPVDRDRELIRRLGQPQLELVDAALDETGLVVANIEDKDPMDRVTLARSFGSPAVKVSVDTGHANYAHGSTGAPPP